MERLWENIRQAGAGVKNLASACFVFELFDRIVVLGFVIFVKGFIFFRCAPVHDLLELMGIEVLVVAQLFNEVQGHVGAMVGDSFGAG